MYSYTSLFLVCRRYFQRPSMVHTRTPPREQRSSFAMANNDWARVALCALCTTCAIMSSSAFLPSPQQALARQTTLSHGQIGFHPYSSLLFLSPSANNNEDLIDEESEEFQRKVRVARAKAEIDRILKAPDAPFDLEGELKKCDGISSPLAHREQLLDDQVGELEAELYAAVEQQDYPLAQQKKEEIGKMHMDDCGAVLQVNSAFYKAFSDKDYNAMEKLWLKEASILCIHPAHTPLVGANAVLTSWKHIFESSNGSFQRTWMAPSKIRLSVKGATAILACDEEVFLRRFIRGKKRQTELVSQLTATNIFRKVDGNWYMVHHHASWHADSEAAKLALKGGGPPAKIKGGDKKSLLQRRSRSVDNGEPKISPDGILGNFGPILGGPSPAPQAGAPIKRVIMGNLSDLLNGGLNELLSENSDDHQDEEEGTAIIQFHQVDEDDEDDAEDDDDDSDENDGTEAVSIIKQWGKSLDDDGSTRSESSPSRSTSGPNDALRQNCISALRKLANQGSISPKQKRLLLTDIITCSAKGEFSMVEVAYELLCGEGEDKDAAEEEFADQCRVFAHQLPENPSSAS